MLKNKRKFLAIIFLIIVTISTMCFAEGTDEVAPISEATVTSEEPDANGENVEPTENPAEEPTDGEGEVSDGENVDGEVVEPNLIEEDCYLYGDTVTIEKTDYIDGNVYIVGGDVTVSGQIGGDLFVLANNLTLTQDCYTYGNLYACAGKLTIDGIVCDLYAFSPEITLGESGVVLRDSRTASNTFNLNGSIGRNAFLETSQIAMAETAHVYGGFNYSADEEIVIPSGTVDGTIEYTENSIDLESENVGDVIYSYVLDFVYTLVYTLVVFGLILLVSPKFIEKLVEVSKTKKLASFAIGLLLLILIPIVALLLVFTVIGTPLVFALVALYALVISITFTITAISLSKVLSNKVAALEKFHGVFALVIVTLILWALKQIPFFVGGIISLLITIFGMGVFALSIFKKESK